MVRYFCGQDDLCRVDVTTPDALQMAKKMLRKGRDLMINMERTIKTLVFQRFAVVGILEDIDASLLVMDKLLPR